MNFKTVTLTDLKKDANQLFGGVTREQPLRVLHRAHDIKVVIPLDQYLDLIGYWQSGMKNQNVERSPLAEQLQRVQREFLELNKMLGAELEDTDTAEGITQRGRKLALPK